VLPANKNGALPQQNREAVAHSPISLQALPSPSPPAQARQDPSFLGMNPNLSLSSPCAPVRRRKATIRKLTVKQDREPSLGPPSPCASLFALPHSAPPFFTGRSRHNIHPGPGILTWFPFAGRHAVTAPQDGTQPLLTEHASRHDRLSCSFVRALSHRLGPANPCPTAVHMEPFSTSAFKVLI